jgi:hypothetical protein
MTLNGSPIMGHGYTYKRMLFEKGFRRFLRIEKIKIRNHFNLKQSLESFSKEHQPYVSTPALLRLPSILFPPSPPLPSSYFCEHVTIILAARPSGQLDG